MCKKIIMVLLIMASSACAQSGGIAPVTTLTKYTPAVGDVLTYEIIDTQKITKPYQQKWDITRIQNIHTRVGSSIRRKTVIHYTIINPDGSKIKRKWTRQYNYVKKKFIGISITKNKYIIDGWVFPVLVVKSATNEAWIAVRGRYTLFPHDLLFLDNGKPLVRLIHIQRNKKCIK